MLSALYWEFFILFKISVVFVKVGHTCSCLYPVLGLTAVFPLSAYSGNMYHLSSSSFNSACLSQPFQGPLSLLTLRVEHICSLNSVHSHLYSLPPLSPRPAYSWFGGQGPIFKDMVSWAWLWPWPYMRLNSQSSCPHLLSPKPRVVGAPFKFFSFLSKTECHHAALPGTCHLPQADLSLLSSDVRFFRWQFKFLVFSVLLSNCLSPCLR